MKTLTLSLLLLVLTPSLRAQELATAFSPATELHDAAGPLPASLNADGTPGTLEAIRSNQATASVNGISIDVQTLPASGTVLVTVSMPPQETLSLLELANATTGEIVFTGTVAVQNGQFELPVVDISQPYEARLATDREVVIARMTAQ